MQLIPADLFEDLMRKYAPGSGGMEENPYRSQFLRPEEDIFPETSERPDPAIWAPGQSPEELHGEDIKWREMGQAVSAPHALPVDPSRSYPLRPIEGSLDELFGNTIPGERLPGFISRPNWSTVREHNMLGDYYQNVKQDPETGQWFQEKADIYDFGTPRMMDKWHGQPRYLFRRQDPVPAWLQDLPANIRDQVTKLKLAALNARGEPFAMYGRSPLVPIEGPYRDERERLYRLQNSKVTRRLQ